MGANLSLKYKERISQLTHEFLQVFFYYISTFKNTNA